MGDLALDGCGHRVARQIAIAPKSGHRRADDEIMGAGVVGDQLRGAGALKYLEAGVRNLDRWMSRADRFQDFLDTIFSSAWRQVPGHAEGEFSLGDGHTVVAEGQRCAVFEHVLGQ